MIMVCWGRVGRRQEFIGTRVAQEILQQVRQWSTQSVRDEHHQLHNRHFGETGRRFGIDPAQKSLAVGRFSREVY